MARLTLLLALIASMAVVAWAGRFDFDERALLAELEGRPLSPHASLLSLDDLSADSLALLQADGHEVAGPTSLLQIQSEASASDDAADTLLMEVSAQAEPDLQSLNAQAKKEFDEGLRAHNEVQMESQDHSFVELEAEAETEAEAEVYADAESYVEANPHLFTEMAAEADAGADADVNTEAEAEAATQAEAETEAGAEAFLSASTLESAHFDAQAALAHDEVPMPGMSMDGAMEMDADFPEASAALVEMQSQASAAAAVMATAQARVEGLLENRGRLGNYPGWNPMALLEMMAESAPATAPAATTAAAPAPAAAAPAPVAAAASAQPVVAAAAAAPADPTAGQFAPVVKQLPPKSANVKHITLNQGSGGAALPNSGDLGVSKVNVHVYGAPDIDQDKQAALQSMVRRLADNQSESYKKINTLLKKLKMCQINGKTKECLPKITEKIEDFKAEWLADAKRV